MVNEPAGDVDLSPFISKNGIPNYGMARLNKRLQKQQRELAASRAQSQAQAAASRSETKSGLPQLPVRTNFLAYLHTELVHVIDQERSLPLYRLSNDINNWMENDVWLFFTVLGLEKAARKLWRRRFTGTTILMLRRQQILSAEYNLLLGDALKVFAIVERLRAYFSVGTAAEALAIPQPTDEELEAAMSKLPPRPIRDSTCVITREEGDGQEEEVEDGSYLLSSDQETAEPPPPFEECWAEEKRQDEEDAAAAAMAMVNQMDSEVQLESGAGDHQEGEVELHETIDLEEEMINEQ